jgi:hypothetical protein
MTRMGRIVTPPTSAIMIGLTMATAAFYVAVSAVLFQVRKGSHEVNRTLEAIRVMATPCFLIKLVVPIIKIHYIRQSNFLPVCKFQGARLEMSGRYRYGGQTKRFLKLGSNYNYLAP